MNIRKCMYLQLVKSLNSRCEFQPVNIAGKWWLPVLRGFKKRKKANWHTIFGTRTETDVTGQGFFFFQNLDSEGQWDMKNKKAQRECRNFQSIWATVAKKNPKTKQPTHEKKITTRRDLIMWAIHNCKCIHTYFACTEDWTLLKLKNKMKLLFNSMNLKDLCQLLMKGCGY